MGGDRLDRGKIGCTAATLRSWVRQARRKAGQHAGASTEERERIRALEREVREPRQANEILRKASAYFAQAELDRRLKPSTAAPSIRFRQEAGAQGTGRDRVHPRASARAQRDTAPCLEIRRVFEENFRVYGVRKVWRQLGRQGITVARCTVARLMRRMGRRGAVRGRRTRTTVPDRAALCPLDRVQRQFTPPQPKRGIAPVWWTVRGLGWAGVR